MGILWGEWGFLGVSGVNGDFMGWMGVNGDFMGWMGVNGGTWGATTTLYESLIDALSVFNRRRQE